LEVILLYNDFITFPESGRLLILTLGSPVCGRCRVSPVVSKAEAVEVANLSIIIFKYSSLVINIPVAS
jgi:hypothetical protein